ncbi:MAG: hypothetical protein VKJ27_09735 [Synechocystis sp.]|nr:hypothetical protein [Synechocystis sp.]
MPDFQTFIAILTTLLVFLTGVALKYDTLAFRNYTISIPQWAGLSFAGITFTFVVLDQLLRGFVRLEEIQRRTEEVQRRAEEEQRRREEDRRRRDELARAENERLEERNRRLEEEQRRRDELARAENARAKSAERETRRIRIETRYRTAIIRFQLDPNFQHRQQLANVLALLEEYQDTL